MAAKSTEAALFGPFWGRFTDNIHVLSIAHTPFQTVSLLDFGHL